MEQVLDMGRTSSIKESNLCSGTRPLVAADFFDLSKQLVDALILKSEIITTGQPKRSESLMSILSPDFSTRSAMLRAAPRRQTCLDDLESQALRLRSRLVASHHLD